MRLWVLAFLGCFFLLYGCAPKSVKPPISRPPVGPSTTEPPAVEVPAVEPMYRALSEHKASALAGKLSPRLQNITNWQELRPGLEANLKYARSRPRQAACVDQPGLSLTWGQLADSVAEMLTLLPELDRDQSLIAKRFTWYKLEPGTMLTGYYEPWLKAAREADGTYLYPLYDVPRDLKSIDLGKFHHRWAGQSLIYRMGEDGIEPYYDRAAIDGLGVLAGKGAEVAWARSLVDIFFLQVQGSGRLIYPDGTVKHILYSGKNGLPYVSIGRLLIEGGHVPREEMSMQRIRRYLEENPGVARRLMNENPSYVFFHLSDEGPFGAIGSLLMPRISVAVDRKVVPLGGVLALETALMDYTSGTSDPFFSLVLAQDTGGAIQGTRCDFFSGSGEEAELLAGHLQEQAQLYLLISNNVLK